MNLRLLTVPAVFISLFASAFGGNTVSGVIALPAQAQRSTAIALVQPADYVCATISVSSRERDPARQAEEIRSTVRLLSSSIAKSPRFQLHDGPIRLYGGGRNGESLLSSRLLSLPSGLSSSVAGTSAFATSVRILYKLDGAENDSLTAASALRKLVEEFKVPTLTDLRISSLSLAVDSPERQRERLLSLIRESAESMKRTFKADQVTIGGLDGPVLVRQVDDESVELFIDYQLSVTAGTASK